MNLRFATPIASLLMRTLASALPVNGGRHLSSSSDRFVLDAALEAPAGFIFEKLPFSRQTRPFSTRMSALPGPQPEGEPDTTDFRIQFYDAEGKKVSPWHNVPLKSGNLYNMIVEIPRFSRAKMEISTKEENNPIKQDMKKGKLRYYHGPIFWNYGALPQTWEDPQVVGGEELFGSGGDNDPVDVVEIGETPVDAGSIMKVKPVGCLAMIDDGEVDWKVLAIREGDPKFDLINDISDVDTHYPGTVAGVREWFRWYKTPDGKPVNKFGYDEEAKDKSFAEKVIEETHGHWQALRGGQAEAGKLWVGQMPAA